MWLDPRSTFAGSSTPAANKQLSARRREGNDEKPHLEAIRHVTYSLPLSVVCSCDENDLVAPLD